MNLQKACEIAKKAKETDAKELYHATAIASDLPSCALSFPKAQETLAAVAADEKATSQTIYFALAAAEQLKVKGNRVVFIRTVVSLHRLLLFKPQSYC